MYRRGIALSAMSSVLVSGLLFFSEAGAQNVLTYLGQETPVTVPDCIAGTGTAIVGNDSDLVLALNDPAIDVICMMPGHYSKAFLQFPGTQQAPKYLVPDHPAGAPVTAPWNLPDAERVIFDDAIYFVSDFWYVVGVTVRSDRAAAVDFDTGSFGNVIDSALIEGLSERLPRPSNGQTMVRMGELSLYNTVQNSILRNSPRIPGEDSHCLYLANSQYNTIIDNEIYDCAGDAIQFGWQPGSAIVWDDRGNKIVGNEIYVTPRLYADCKDTSADANLNGPGECACSENAVDIKIISAGPIDPSTDLVEISHNTTYGFRENHQACGGTGDTGASAIFLHNEFTSFARIYNNLIFDADTGILLQDFGQGGMTDIEVFNNVLYNIRVNSAIQLGGGTGSRIAHNTMILTLTDRNKRLSIRISPSVLGATVVHNLTISENLLYKGFMDANNPDPSSILVALNGYVDKASPIRNASEKMKTSLPSEPLSNYDELCVTLNRYSGGTLTCIPYVIPNSNSGIIDRFKNPKYSYDVDFFDNPRISPRDLGAVEH